MNFKLTINSLIELVWPRTCIICASPKYDLCPACRLKIIAAPQFCPLCFQRSKLGYLCQKCRLKKEAIYFDALYIHSNPENNLVGYCLKCIRDKGQKKLAYILGSLLSKKLTSEFTDFQLIIPWPITKLEERQRGYNQNFYIAQGFNINTRLMIATRCLSVRKRHKPVFKWQGPALKQENIIVISDFLPDNNSINLAAQTVKLAGAAKVIFIAISRKL